MGGAGELAEIVRRRAASSGTDILPLGGCQLWAIDFPTLLLVLIGAIHLGVSGLFDVDLITKIMGQYARHTEILIGAAGVWQIFRQRWV
jgi:uncharacterized membrane protein YuzA (DUF378 family)